MGPTGPTGADLASDALRSEFELINNKLFSKLCIYGLSYLLLCLDIPLEPAIPINFSDFPDESIVLGPTKILVAYLIMPCINPFWCSA